MNNKIKLFSLNHEACTFTKSEEYSWKIQIIEKQKKSSPLSLVLNHAENVSWIKSPRTLGVLAVTQQHNSYKNGCRARWLPSKHGCQAKMAAKQIWLLAVSRSIWKIFTLWMNETYSPTSCFLLANSANLLICSSLIVCHCLFIV